MQLSETEVHNGIDELNEKNMLFHVTGAGSRVVKYNHRFCNTEFSSLQLTQQQLAIICVLLLRGPQTPGELRTRANRLASFNKVTDLESVLDSLTDLDTDTLVVKLPREPGKRDARYTHLFCGENDFVQAPTVHNEQVVTLTGISSI